MKNFALDRRVEQEKSERRQEKRRQDSAPVPEERPQVRRSFDEIYSRDQFTLEAAVKAFIKP